MYLHRGPTDVEDDRPPHPKMARAVSASRLYASIVTFHAGTYERLGMLLYER